MLLYIDKDKSFIDYESKKVISNSLTDAFKYSVYEDSDEMLLMYSLKYMKDNAIDNVTVVFPLDTLTVNYGNANDIDKEYCDLHGIQCRYENRSGGAMVLFPENIIVHDVRPAITFETQYSFMDRLVEYFKSKGLNATTSRNDILIDGNKVVGAVSDMLKGTYEGMMFFGLSISIHADPELVSRICMKPSVKPAGALSDYGITHEEMFDYILQWFDEHRYNGG